MNDGLVEASETVTATLAVDPAYIIGTAKTGTVVIQDNDTVVTIAASDATATEAGPTTGRFTITRAGNTSAALAVSMTYGGTATKAVDRLLLPVSVTIPVGATSVSITVTPIADNIAEPAETVIATLGASAGYTLGASKSATVTIVDQ